MNLVVDCTVESITVIDSDVYDADVFVQIYGLEPKCLGQITKRSGRINFRQSALLIFAVPTDFSSPNLPLIFTASLFSRKYIGQVNLTPGIQQAKNGITSIVSEENSISLKMSAKGFGKTSSSSSGK